VVTELLQTFAVLSKRVDFWNSHDIDCIPPSCIGTIHQLVDSEVECYGPGVSFENFHKYMDIINNADCYHGITGWLPLLSIAEALSEKVMNGAPVEIIITPKSAEELFQDPYQSLILKLLKYPNLKFWVSSWPLTFGLTLTDTSILLKVALKKGKIYDTSRIFAKKNKNASMWGERMFGHYRNNSVLLDQYLDK
jgi:predicted transcriptional regulator